MCAQREVGCYACTELGQFDDKLIKLKGNCC